MMIATILAILCLPIKILWYLFGYSHVVSKEEISLVSSSSSCSSTPSLAESLTQFPTEEEEGDIHTACCSNCSDSILQQVHQMVQQNANTNSRTLTLTNFVEHCKDSRDALAVKEVLQYQHQPRWHSLHLLDTVDATKYRRWNYKKTGIHRSLHESCHLPVTCTTTIRIHTDSMKPASIVSVLKSLQSDTDVKCLIVEGNLHYKDTETIALALVAVLADDHRNWKCIEWNVHVTQKEKVREAKLVERICQKALQKVANERYITFKTK